MIERKKTTSHLAHPASTARWFTWPLSLYINFYGWIHRGFFMYALSPTFALQLVPALKILHDHEAAVPWESKLIMCSVFHGSEP